MTFWDVFGRIRLFRTYFKAQKVFFKNLGTWGESEKCVKIWIFTEFWYIVKNGSKTMIFNEFQIFQKSFPYPKRHHPRLFLDQ